MAEKQSADAILQVDKKLMWLQNSEVQVKSLEEIKDFLKTNVKIKTDSDRFFNFEKLAKKLEEIGWKVARTINEKVNSRWITAKNLIYGNNEFATDLENNAEAEILNIIKDGGNDINNLIAILQWEVDEKVIGSINRATDDNERSVNFWRGKTDLNT